MPTPFYLLYTANVGKKLFLQQAAFPLNPILNRISSTRLKLTGLEPDSEGEVARIFNVLKDLLVLILHPLR